MFLVYPIVVKYCNFGIQIYGSCFCGSMLFLNINHKNKNNNIFKSKIDSNSPKTKRNWSPNYSSFGFSQISLHPQKTGS